MTRWSLLLGLVMLSSAACASILGFKPRARESFEHRAHALEGIHCVRCHTGVSDAGETGPLHLPDAAQCQSCHQKPHDDRDCMTCHSSPHARQTAELARHHLRFEHRTHVSRVDGDCVRCHLDVAHGSPILRPTMANCLSCHEHKKEFTARNCDACHLDLREEGTPPDDHLVHTGDVLRDHGVRAAAERELCASCHTESFCTGCHGGGTVPIPLARLNFEDPKGSRLHRAGFMSRHAEEARGNPGLCTTCHAPDGCKSCHEREGRAAPRPGSQSIHPRGWVGLPGQSNAHGRAAWRDPALCASCHGGAGEMLCVGCHKVGAIGGNPHPPGWSSRMQPRIDRPCRLCHEALP